MAIGITKGKTQTFAERVPALLIANSAPKFLYLLSTTCAGETKQTAKYCMSDYSENSVERTLLSALQLLSIGDECQSKKSGTKKEQ